MLSVSAMFANACVSIEASQTDGLPSAGIEAAHIAQHLAVRPLAFW